MYKRLVLSCSLISLLLGSIGAQQNFNLESMIPPAPNAAELGKYGTIPVGTLTGVPQISFPLYDISSGQLKLPISLAYHASGIQVNQQSTDVGLGWSVIAGGEISRTVYGAADEGTYGYFNYNPPSLSTLINTTNYYSMQYYCSTNNLGYDLEPDLFVYNIGGKSGKFFCNKNKNFVTIPFEPIKIQKGTNGQGLSFEITDDDGTMYNFDKYSSTLSDFSGVRNTRSTWYLTSMISADFVDTISFVYESVTIEDPMEQHIYPIGKKLTDCTSGFTFVSGDQFSSNGVKVVNSTNNYNELLIKQINFRNGYVQFNRNTIRKDVSLQSNLLDEMVIYNKSSQVIKKVNFNHDYFLATDFYDGWEYYRLKLTGFTESDENSTAKKQYSFDYNSTSFPHYGSYDIDYWGFYNGSNNQNLIPVTTVHASEISNVSFANGETYTNNFYDGSQSWTIGNANREPSETYMKAGILEKVTYPTGGYSKFEFDAHRYLSDQYIQQSAQAGGTSYGNDSLTKSTSTYNFSIPSSPGLVSVNQNPINVFLSINFSASNMRNTEFGETQLVTLTDLTSNTFQTWRHEGDLTVPYSVNATFLLYPQHNYVLKNEIYGPRSVSINSSVSWTENTTAHPVKIGGGLRIRSIKNYNSDNSLAHETDYAYGVAENSLGIKLFDETNFYKNYEDVVEKYYCAYGGGPACVSIGTYWQRRFLGISKYNSLNYLGSPVLYPSVTKYEGTSTANIGKTIFEYNIAPDVTNLPGEFVNSGNYGSINNAWVQGELSNETTYRNDGAQYTPVSKVHNEYTKYNQATETGILFKQFMQFVKFDNCGNDPTGPEPSSTKPGQGFFTFFEYPIKTGISKRTTEVKTVYDQNDISKSIVTTTNYQYQNGANRYLTESSMTTSDGNLKITRLKYPQDLTDAVSTAMVQRNILSPVLEEKRLKSQAGVESLLSTTQTIYKQINNLIERSVINASLGANLPENRIQFNQYDNYGNIVERQKTADTKEVYLWGYRSTYPVAKILNTTYDVAKTYINQSDLDYPTDDATLRNRLNNLRNIPGAFVTTYTYKPLIGVTSETDLNGRTTYYEYDAMGRLSIIKDKDGNILKKFCYNYAGEVETCQ